MSIRACGAGEASVTLRRLLQSQWFSDPSGNYGILVPLDVPGFDYSNADLEAFDPVSGNYISDETVNISALSPTNSLTVPSLSGQCNDDDAPDPDEDDPDCD